MLKFYTGFEINDQTGNALTQKEMTTLHYDKITSLQVSPAPHLDLLASVTPARREWTHWE